VTPTHYYEAAGIQPTSCNMVAASTVICSSRPWRVVVGEAEECTFDICNLFAGKDQIQARKASKKE
jgi:hypothetical protein